MLTAFLRSGRGFCPLEMVTHCILACENFSLVLRRCFPCPLVWVAFLGAGRAVQVPMPSICIPLGHVMALAVGMAPAVGMARHLRAPAGRAWVPLALRHRVHKHCADPVTTAPSTSSLPTDTTGLHLLSPTLATAVQAEVYAVCCLCHQASRTSIPPPHSSLSCLRGRAPLSMCSSSDSRQKKWHTEPVELNVHPNRQFPAHFVIHMPSCLHILFYVARPLHSGARGPSLGVCSLGGATICIRPGTGLASGSIWQQCALACASICSCCVFLVPDCRGVAVQCTGSRSVAHVYIIVLLFSVNTGPA